MRAYSQAAKDRSLEIEAVAIRTVAERRLGQILSAERDAGRLAHHGVGTPSESTHATLTSIGVSGKLSARAAKLAGCPTGGHPAPGVRLPHVAECGRGESFVLL